MSSNFEGIISFLLQLDCDDSVKKNYIFYSYKVHILSWTDVKDTEDQKRTEKSHASQTTRHSQNEFF